MFGVTARHPVQPYCKIGFGGRAPRRSVRFFPSGSRKNLSTTIRAVYARSAAHTFERSGETIMAVGAKIAKTADRKKVMDTTKSTDCPKCGKPTRIVKRVKDRERGIPGGVYISCSACEFFEKL